MWFVIATLAYGAEPSNKRVLLLGQKPDGHPPGTHEYVAGMKIVAALLAKQPGIATTLESADEPWNDGPQKLREADGAVVFLSQGAVWLSADPRRLDAFASLAARKGGLVVIHWGMGTKAVEPIQPWLQLFGGCHGGPDRRFKVIDATLEPVAPPHVITRGVSPLPVHEEFYYALKFVKSSTPIEPVLQVEIEGRRETVAWAWTRPDGGRSFGFSGLHFHDNWRHESYRRLITHGVLWSLGREIPVGGADVAIDTQLLKLAESK
ncbi:MAG: ThuA domain-containing protein [Planctomycetaceae bacterium]|nr:ThuA domain-containing protein [Planctomycetaceae bacterium]